MATENQPEKEGPKQKKEPLVKRSSESGAENGARTRDLNLGKVTLYQLSYFRDWDCKYKSENFILQINLHFRCCLEFVQETHVVLEVVTEIVYAPLEHGNTLQAHAECES